MKKYCHGEFLRIWQNAEALGYKRYRWSIAKHKHGETDPTLMLGWLPNFHWISKQTLDAQRRIYSNDQWLVEVLGGISLKSGLVARPLILGMANEKEKTFSARFRTEDKITVFHQLKALDIDEAIEVSKKLAEEKNWKVISVREFSAKKSEEQREPKWSLSARANGPHFLQETYTIIPVGCV
ncbi:MAG: hypothetical protein ABSF24_07830 [Candidatus Bathyarchaeia archaeon]